MARATDDDLNLVLSDDTWAARSTAAEDLAPRIGFPLEESRFVGDWESERQFLDPSFHRPLELPALPRRNRLFPVAAEVEGHAAELAEYYRLALGSDADESWMFGVALVLESASLESGLDFPIWLRFSQMQPFLDWAASEQAESRFDDLDQGWLFKAQVRGDRLHFYQGGFDQGGEYANLSVDRRTFVGRLEAERHKASVVIAELKALTGRDLWM